jgi:hypothetical protein
MITPSIEIDPTHEKRKRLRDERLLKASKTLSGNFPSLSEEEIEAALVEIWYDYSYYWTEVERLEKASKARRDLLELAGKAEVLKSAMLALGQGAIEAMNLQTERVDLHHEGDPAGLPCRNPICGPWPTEHKTAEEAYACYGSGCDEERGGRWVVRLHALAELARLKADKIHALAGKGGRRSSPVFRNRGSVNDWLAEACHVFAKSHGCRTQTVAVEMMRTILVMKHGEAVAQCREVSRPSRDLGRKAVRRAAQLDRDPDPMEEGWKW